MPNQIEFFDISNPCKRECQTDKQGYCMSCYRSRDERFNWLNYSEAQKSDILRLCKQRALRKRYYVFQQQKQQALAKAGNDEQLDLF